jgi:hypothetical protein|tara:strand:- start:300 stop:500 length:201 start_codon:yes stop_codon:yes gene_type:complete
MSNIYQSQNDVQWRNQQGLLDANYNKGVDVGVSLVVEKLQNIEAYLRETNQNNADLIGEVIREITK